MPEIVVRISILLLVGGVVWLSVTFSKRFVEARRQRALSASLPDTLSSVINTDNTTNKAHVRILASSTPDCQQCHRLPAPALHRALDARGDSVGSVDIDATTSPELPRRHHQLTVPTTA